MAPGSNSAKTNLFLINNIINNHSDGNRTVVNDARTSAARDGASSPLRDDEWTSNTEGRLLHDLLRASQLSNRHSPYQSPSAISDCCHSVHHSFASS